MIKKYLFIGLLLLAGCQPDIRTEKDLLTYIYDRDNGLCLTEEIKDLKVQVTYRPAALLIMQEMHQPHVSLSALQKKYSQQAYFSLSLSHDDQEVLNSGGMEFSDLVRTLSFRMRDFVHLVTDQGDTLEVTDYVFPRTFGYHTSTDLLFAFPAEELQNRSYITFLLQDIGLGTGDVSFRFDMEDIRKVPQPLQLKQALAMTKQNTDLH